MSIVSDLREVLQDVVAPDLKAVVRGLADLKEEVRSSNALLREEMRSNVTQLREEMQNGNALLREEMRSNVTQLREEMQNGNALLRNETAGVEKRTAEKIERVYDAVKISDLTYRNAELEKQLEQMRNAQQTQQH